MWMGNNHKQWSSPWKHLDIRYFPDGTQRKKSKLWYESKGLLKNIDKKGKCKELSFDKPGKYHVFMRIKSEINEFGKTSNVFLGEFLSKVLSCTVEKPSISFPVRLSLKEAEKLKVHDKVDHR